MAQEPIPADKKKPYTPPTLTKYGNVADATAKTGTQADGSGNMFKQ